VDKFYDQNTDNKNFKQNLPTRIRHLINLTKEHSTCDDDDDDVEEGETVSKKPAVRKRYYTNFQLIIFFRYSNFSFYYRRKSDDSTSTAATSTPERHKEAPPYKKQKFCSSFTILNQAESSPSLHRQMGRKWTEQHELEMPETDEDCSTANNSLTTTADENDGEGPGNKTVIDNSVNQWICILLKVRF
jgi:hypothetical protein